MAKEQKDITTLDPNLQFICSHKSGTAQMMKPMTNWSFLPWMPMGLMIVATDS